MYAIPPSGLSSKSVAALCSLCYQVSLRRGFDRRSPLFQRLSLQPDLLVSIWASLTSLTMSRSFGCVSGLATCIHTLNTCTNYIMYRDPVSCLHQLSKGLSLPPTTCLVLVQQLTTFCLLFSLYLSTLHDAEFYSELQGSNNPFSLDQLSDMVPPLRDVFITLQLDNHLPASHHSNKSIQLKPSLEVRVYSVLYRSGIGHHRSGLWSRAVFTMCCVLCMRETVGGHSVRVASGQCFPLYGTSHPSCF